MPQLHWLPQDPQWSARLAASTGEHAPAWSDLVALANSRLDFVQTNRLDKLLRRHFTDAPDELAPHAVRLAVLGSSTTEHLLPGLRVGALRRNLWLTTYAPAYGQYLQDLLDRDSGLHAFKPTTVLCAFDTQDLLGDVPSALSASDADVFVAAALDRLRDIWQRLREQFSCDVIQQTLLPTALPLLGSNEQRLPGSRHALIARINHALRQAADDAGIDLLAIDDAAARDGIEAWHDRRMWLRAKQYVAPPAAPAYGDLMTRLIAARRGRSFKCLVLDLDNTLWGGVIGDDGVDRIVLGQGDATGEAFLDFQRYALDLSARGVLLAVCSKNDDANARLPFTSHPEMLIKLDNVACFVANWEDKASNLRAIAEQLNIGLDSLVFADDNPFERNLVRRQLPMVAVPELPEDPAFYAETIAAGGYFESVRVTPEDLQRSGLYQVDIQRQSARTSHADLASYLASLDMRLEWNHVDAADLSRVVQLINKTNQFNLTTRRYGEEQVRAWMHDPRTLLLRFRLKDCFGDNGIIAVVMALPEGESSWLIDTWLMSCRVLGRDVERATLNVLVEAAASIGATRLRGMYLPSPKNGMVSKHYESLGFTLDETESSGQFWTLELGGYLPTQTSMNIERT